MKTVRNCTGFRGERGAETVEAGFIVLLMFGLLFLLMNLALGIFVKSTLQYAVREGVRFAITAQNLPTKSYLNDSIISVVQQNSLGLLNGTAGACKIAINYYNASGESAGAGGGNIVQVAVQGYNFSFLSSPVLIGATSSDVMEACPVAGCPTTLNPVPLSCP